MAGVSKAGGFGFGLAGVDEARQRRAVHLLEPGVFGGQECPPSLWQELAG